MSRRGILTITPNASLDVWTTTPRLLDGPKQRCSAPVLYAGGGGINVSRVLDRLGAETTALFASGGCTGERLADELARAGVRSERVTFAGDSRENVPVQDVETGAVYRLVLPGPEISPDEERELVRRVAALAENAALVVGSGTLLPGTSAGFWAEIAAGAKAAGARFVLDTASAVGPALEEGVFLLRLNGDEFAALACRALEWPREVAEWASAQVACGACEVAVLTQGGDGAVMVTADERLLVKPPFVRVTSAIGAGDRFVPGLCLALAEERPHADVLRLAVAAAAAAMLTPGTPRAPGGPESTSRAASCRGIPSSRAIASGWRQSLPPPRLPGRRLAGGSESTGPAPAAIRPVSRPCPGARPTWRRRGSSARPPAGPSSCPWDSEAHT